MTLPAAAARVPAVIDRSTAGTRSRQRRSISAVRVRSQQETSRTKLLLSIDGTDKRTDGRTDGRTPDCYVDPAPRTMRTASVMYYWFAGWGPAQATIRNGARWGTYNAFLKRTLSRESVHIITHAVVQKVVYADKLSALEYSRW